MSNQSKSKILCEKVISAIKKNRQSELFYKAFLTPIEIALKTYLTENETDKIGCMPYGIKQVFKTSLNDNKFMLDDFQPIDVRMGFLQNDNIAKFKQKLAHKLKREIDIKKFNELLINEAIDKLQSSKCSWKDLQEMTHLISDQRQKEQYEQEVKKFCQFDSGIYEIEDVKNKRCDNLISLMKPSNQGSTIKIAICICMYSQDKSMLKRTLAGVSKNIEVFVENGYTYNDIGVFVIMDGIEVVHSTVQQLFDELQKENGIYLSDDIEPTNIEEFNNEHRDMEDEEVDNLNHLIFTKSQLQERKLRRFSQRKKQYKIHKEMIKSIQKLEKDKNLTYDALNPISQRFFLEKAQERYKRDYALTDEQAKNVDQNFLLENYAQNIKTSSPIIQESLSETKRYCSEYVSSRDNLALLNCFRVSIKTPKIQKKQAGANGANYEAMNEEENEENDRLAVKMNLFMVTKYKNRGKLSSHNWFFNGFCQQLKPQYAVLLDVGLVPEGDALWKMCSHMEHNPSVGGVCGYMGLRIERLDDDQEIQDESIDCITALAMKLVDIQRAQQFEYHFAHLIDKPFESSSCFKFIHVLPGAFSAYRMAALRPEGASDSKLLKQYFKSIEESSSSMIYKAEPYTVLKTISKVVLPDLIYNCFYGKPADGSYEKLLYDENVYLAEDRTLCMGIHQNEYDLVYLPDANAWVDPIKTLYGLLGQRKRWINGSFFAFEKVKETLESKVGECCLKLQIMYLTFMNWLSFVAPALFMFTIHIAMTTFQINVIIPVFQNLKLVENSAAVRNNYVVGLFVYLVDLIYVMIFFGLVFYSMHLTNREPKFKTFFYGVSTTYGIFSLSVFGVLLYDIISGFTGKNAFLIENPWFVDMISGGEAVINSLRYIMIGIMCLYVVPVMVSLIFCKFGYIIDILFSTFSFIFYSPTYLNILNIYALCRMDDISWGTKGLNTETGRNKQMVEEWKKIKLIHVSKFVLYNLVVGFALILFGDEYATRFWLTFSIMILLGFTLGIKVLFGAIYLISYRLCNKKNNSTNNGVVSDKEDQIEKNFEKVKQSLYKGIRNSIEDIEKMVDKENEVIPMSSMITSSRINFKMKFGRNSKNAINLGKKSIEEWQALSKIQKKNMSTAIQKAQKKRVIERESKVMKEAEQKREDATQIQLTQSKSSDQKLKERVEQPRPRKQIVKKIPERKRAL